jgi:hypothetical protein
MINDGGRIATRESGCYRGKDGATQRGSAHTRKCVSCVAIRDLVENAVTSKTCSHPLPGGS